MAQFFGRTSEFLSAWSKIESISPSDCRESVLNRFSLESMEREYITLMERIIQHGNLDHNPKYNFKPESVKFLYKPTLINRMKHRILGKM